MATALCIPRCLRAALLPTTQSQAPEELISQATLGYIESFRPRCVVIVNQSALRIHWFDVSLLELGLGRPMGRN